MCDIGADVHCKDVLGKTGFDYIADHKEWIESGFFTEATQAQLNSKILKSSRCDIATCITVYSLKQARLLVRTITEKVMGRIQ